MVAQDAGYNPADGDDAAQWANDLGVTHPVVADPYWSIGDLYEVDWSIPSLTLIGPGMEVLIEDGWITEDDIEAALPD